MTTLSSLILPPPELGPPAPPQAASTRLPVTAVAMTARVCRDLVRCMFPSWGVVRSDELVRCADGR